MNSQDIQYFFEILKPEFDNNKSYLNDLDAAVGDGDHGSTINRGMNASFDAVCSDAAKSNNDTPSIQFKNAAKAFQSATGGAGGILFSSLFLGWSQFDPEASDISLQGIADGLDFSVARIKKMGKAKLGDKTMLDALSPAADAFRENLDHPLGQLIEATLLAANEGAQSTIAMHGKLGRAKYVVDQGAGHQDPGTASIVLILEALGKSLLNSNAH